VKYLYIELKHRLSIEPTSYLYAFPKDQIQFFRKLGKIHGKAEIIKVRTLELSDAPADAMMKARAK
jgi:hypothetical protein